MNPSPVSRIDNIINPLLINRNFARLWIGRVASAIGDFLFNVTLMLWIVTVPGKGQSWAPLAVSGVFLASSLPTFVIGPLAGVFVDRWNRRVTMLCMDIIRAVLICLLLFLILILGAALGTRSNLLLLGCVYAIVFAVSVCGQFFRPSVSALLYTIVDEADQTRASARLQLIMSLALFIGAPVGTLLFFTVGLQLALLLNALSFVISFVLIYFIRLVSDQQEQEQEDEQSSFWREFGEGIRFILMNRVLLAVLVTTVVIVLGEGCLSSQGIFFAQANLHISLNLFGFLDAALGVGLIVGSIVVQFFVKRLGIIPVYWLSIILAGLVILVFARMVSFFPALAMLFLYGTLVSVGNIVSMPLLFQVIPERLIGRVMAVLDPVTSLSEMLSIALAGLLTSTLLNNFHVALLGIHFNTWDTLFLGTSILALLAGVYAFFSLRGIKIDSGRKEEAEQTEEVTETLI